MHNAPAVTYPVGRSHIQTWLIGVLLLIGAAVTGWWYWLVAGPDWRQALAAGIWLAGAALAGRGLRRPSLGMLRWDGQHWHWESNGTVLTGSVLPRLDWQAGVLLEFRAEAHRARWLWLERGAQTQRWHALRRALWTPGTAAPPLPGLAQDRP